MTKAADKLAAKRKKIRDKLFRDAESRVYSRASGGFAQIPRVVPLVARMANEVGGPENAGPLYQVLWSHDWGQGLVEVKRPRSLLYQAGYAGAGSRADRTWRERIKILVKLGLIDTAPDGFDDHAYVLLVDPRKAIRELSQTYKEKLEKGLHKTFSTWHSQYELFLEQWGMDNGVDSEEDE